MFPYRGHKVWRLIDNTVSEGHLKIIECTLVIAYLTIAGSQRTISTRYLIHIAILFEKIERIFSQIASEHLLVYPVRIQKLHGGHVVSHELVSPCRFHQVLTECLQRIGHKVRHASLSRHQEATHQMVEFTLVDFLLCTFGNDTTSTDVVHIIKVLGRIAQHLVRTNLVQRLNRLTLKTHIIIIGGVHDGILCFCIEQTSEVVRREGTPFFVDTSQGAISQFAIFVEGAIVGTTLTKTHLLHISDEQLNLMTRQLWYLE